MMIVCAVCCVHESGNAIAFYDDEEKHVLAMLMMELLCEV